MCKNISKFPNFQGLHRVNIAFFHGSSFLFDVRLFAALLPSISVKFENMSYMGQGKLANIIFWFVRILSWRHYNHALHKRRFGLSECGHTSKGLTLFNIEVINIGELLTNITSSFLDVSPFALSMTIHLSWHLALKIQKSMSKRRITRTRTKITIHIFLIYLISYCHTGLAVASGFIPFSHS